MAEESEGNFDTEKTSSKHNQDTKKHEDGWIVCRSQKRPGRLYDFNLNTGEAVWRDPEALTHHTAITDKNKVQVDCHEPTDPPIDSRPHHHHNAATSSSAQNIYNKQIINNQFPSKPFTLDPFGNAPCGPYGYLNPNNAIGMNTPQVWVAAPAPPVLIGPPVNPLNQLPIYGGLENMHLQNPSVSLSNRFQILKQMNDGRPIGSDMLNGVGGNQSFKNCNRMPPRRGRNFVNRHINKQNDLRSFLSSRRRQEHQNRAEDIPEMKDDVSARLTEEDLNPDDADEWLEAYTNGEGKKLNIDVGCIWDLAESGTSRDCSYVIPTTRALLNNMRFLTSLVLSDERFRLLAPRDVVRALRSAAFSGDGRLADCASRARTFVIRQMSKIPDALKDAANFKSCRELIGVNTHVVHLIDEKDIPNEEFINCLQITPAKLKRYLESTMNSKPKIVSEMQNIIENIKIVVTNDEAKGDAERLPKCNATARTTSQSKGTERTEPIKQDLINTDKVGFKETEIQTVLTTVRPKLTANASVQTDPDFTLINSEMKPKEMVTQVADIAGASNDVISPKAPTRKIRLRRQQSTNASSNSDEKKTYRWRKRKDAASTSKEASLQQNSYKSCSRGSSPPPSSTSDLLAQQSDNAMDFGHSDFSAHAEIVDESSTSAVISNSIDSDTMFKINKGAILAKTESKTDHKDDIVMHEITSDCMEDRLSMRCDEWVSRFVQIMEEVLSQVLLLDPPFMDSTLPPPWTIQEATVCVKRKLKQHNIITEASDRLDSFLMNMKYDRGNIETRISPTDFMLMYSYGVNLVHKLQVILNNCEDLHIASQNLSKLLSDIREPNLDESYEIENLNCDDPMNSPNISESVTNVSTTDAHAYITPTTKESPQKGRKNILSCNDSPARYSLRSSRSAEKRKKEENTETVSRENKDYTLFASLGLQKNKFTPEKCIEKTIFNSPKVQDHLTSPIVNDAQDAVQDVLENKVARIEPKIIRNFSICPEIENKLKGLNCANTDGGQNDVDYAYGENDFAADDYAAGDFATGDYVTDDYIKGDGNGNAGPHNDDNYNDLLRTTGMDVNQKFETTKLNANGILKLIVQITTYKYRRWLAELHKFCEVTNTAMKNKDCSTTAHQVNVLEKTTKISEHAKNVCNRLKSILNRSPCVTSDKFRDLMKDYGIPDFDMNDIQLAEYRLIIEKYLELAEQLRSCVTRLADTVQMK